MTHRQHFFSVLEGKKPSKMPWFPDITDWYSSARTPGGQEKVWGAAQFIPDTEPFHKKPGTMPEKYQQYTLMDFYRKHDWGFPVHLNNYYRIHYSGGVEKNIKKVQTGRTTRITTLHTPKGDLEERHVLAADGTWGPTEHFIKDNSQLDIMAYVVENTHYEPTYERVNEFMAQMGEQGEGDLVIFRSPFGKLVHQYMGFEKVIYAMFDDLERIHDFLRIQEKKDLELVQIAAGVPERLVIISDHADENLISPSQYLEYCCPFYQKANKILHDAGKFVSTHLDGNFKGYFPYLKETHFDLLDGCTPAPMFNYTPEELAAALPEGMKAFVGIPSTLFCQNLPTKKLFEYADRILYTFTGRGIINIGDILPPNGNIEQVIEVGEYLKSK